MSASTVQGCLQRAVERLGFKKGSLLEAGVSPKYVQKFLGHSSLQTTLRYLHLTEDGERKGRDALNELAQPAGLFKELRRGQR